MSHVVDYDRTPNLNVLFFEQARRLDQKNLLWSKHEGRYRPQRWGEVAEEVKALGRSLRKLGIGKGDRVVLVAENRPEWLIADMAIMAAEAITVPAYITNTTDDHRYVLEHSGAKGAIVSGPQLASRLLPAASETPDCGFLVAIEPLDAEAEASDTLRVHAWRDLIEAGRDTASGEAGASDIEATAGTVKRDDTACFIYTSGTGGVPKAVELSHGAILSNCKGAYDLLVNLGLEDEVFLSFLPLSHSYEHTAGQFFPLSIGAEIYYAEGIEHLHTNLREVRPTIMTAVPRLFESLHDRIRKGLRKESELRQKLFRRTVELGRRNCEDPGSLGPLERVENAILDRLVRRKARERFGGRLKAMVSGGAALNPEIGLFFTGLGIPVYQGYGQTEAGPVVSANRPGKVKMRTVGPTILGVQVKIAEDGEILVRGENVMKGYWRDSEATAETIRDGWLHTGDVGDLDDDGYLRITDRKRDIIVLSGGDNISPARIENLLTMQPEIAQAMVYGDKRPHLVALIVPDEGYLAAWSNEHGAPGDLAQLREDPAFNASIAEVLDRINRELSTIDRVRRFVVASAPFSVAAGTMTPTLKIRRHKILEHYRPELEALYERKAAVS